MNDEENGIVVEQALEAADRICDPDDGSVEEMIEVGFDVMGTLAAEVRRLRESASSAPPLTAVDVPASGPVMGRFKTPEGVFVEGVLDCFVSGAKITPCWLMERALDWFSWSSSTKITRAPLTREDSDAEKDGIVLFHGRSKTARFDFCPWCGKSLVASFPVPEQATKKPLPAPDTSAYTRRAPRDGASRRKGSS